MANVEGNLDGLNKLMRALRQEMVVRVGILGSQAHAIHDPKSGLTNAFIGTIHEFGSISRNIPRRSFLWDSLVSGLNLNAPEFRELRKDLFVQLFNKGKIKDFYLHLGSAALQVIEEGFATNGFGRWPELSPLTLASYARSKGVGARARKFNAKKSRRYEQLMQARQILTNTGKLHKSISFKVIRMK